MDPQAPVTPPTVIVVAGLPRSGSTWLFNAARLVLGTDGPPPYAAWVGDYRPRTATAAVHLVKLHLPDQLTFPCNRILTSDRPIEACVASLIRMGWLASEAGVVDRGRRFLLSLRDHWRARSDLEVAYEDILARPARVVAQVADTLGRAVGPAEAERIAGVLAALRAPEAGPYDPVTLLHPRHRADGGKGA